LAVVHFATTEYECCGKGSGTLLPHLVFTSSHTQKKPEADCHLRGGVVLSVAGFACRTDLIAGIQYPSPNQQWSTVDLFSKVIEVNRK
jgi:hypothetical protein